MRFEPALEAQFRASRLESFADVNTSTFWSMAVIVLAFSAWDAYVDPAHWRAAFFLRLAGVVVILGTGAFQSLPGRRASIQSMAKLRFVVAVMTTAGALGLIDRGLEFGLAGLVVIFLISPYIAIDRRDLWVLNGVALAGVAAIAVGESLDRFTAVNMALHMLLAAVVSSLLARVLEASNRRAFLLDRQLARDARTDALTGLDNRRAFEERAALELRRAARSGGAVSIIMVDIDRFKRINDDHGHPVGDLALRTVADALRSAMRGTDALGRWGGEEFIVLLPETDKAAAVDVAERMRRAVETATFPQVPRGATISLGVATRRVSEYSPDAWAAFVTESDNALYEAKKHGRNRVAAA